MNWQQIREYLEEAVIDHMDRPEVGREWLAQLETSPDGPRLAICMVIDLTHKAVDPKLFTTVLNALEWPSDDAREAFETAMAPHLHDVIAASRHTALPMDGGDRYVRVLTVRDMLTYYLAHRYLVLDRADTTEFLKHVPDGTPLGEVSAEWRGRRPLVWVGSYEAVRTVMKKAESRDQGATHVADALGLSPDPACDSPEQMVLGVVYPPGFSDAECRQPTTFDATWKEPGGLYLSWPREDGWGRTWSVSGTAADRLKERVHRMLQGLTDEFTTELLGVATLREPDPDALLQEGYWRWKGDPSANGANDPLSA